MEKCNIRVKAKLLELEMFVNSFIHSVMPVISLILQVPSPEFSQGIIRVYCIFLEFTKDLSVFGEGVKELRENQEFYKHLVNVFRRLLDRDQPIAVKKEAFHLIALSWDYFDLKLFRAIKENLLQIQKDYFLPSTQGLSLSKESSDFQIISKAFVEFFLRVPNLNTLELLYPLIREENSAYEQELKYVHNQFIQQGQYEKSFADLLGMFYDTNCENGIIDNLRWGIAKRILIPMINFCDEGMLEKLTIAHTHSLIGKIVENKFSEIYDMKEYLFRLREKTFILMIFERIFEKLPSGAIKESIHKSLYGPGSQGNELTKQIISFCGKYRKERPEKYEMIESFTNNQEYIRNFCCSSYAVDVHSKNSKSRKDFCEFLIQGPELDNSTRRKRRFGFTPETIFTHKAKASEIQKPETKISSIYIAASLFSQDIPSVRTVKKKLIEIPEENIDIELEPDVLNSHIVMKPLLEVLEKIENSFGESLDMPQWMQCLHSDFCNQFSYLAIKLFIIKVIVNRQKPLPNGATCG